MAEIGENTAGFAWSTADSSSTAGNTSGQQEIVRPVENFSPDMWRDRFITLPFTNSEFESCSRQVEALKEKVNYMLKTSTRDLIENVRLIDSLSRLGVSYHFENEIEEQLGRLFITLPQFVDNKDHDLHIVAVVFQVFRSHGYKMSCDVFNKFKNSDGTFMEELASNIKGMISLYEASNWGVHGEVILDEALAFTRMHLESLVKYQTCPDHLREYIANALYRPYHKGMQMLEARQYISFYERDDESRNDTLLKFAKYDFNRVQMHLQQEISILSSWYKKSNICSEFRHMRHRIVESFFYAVGALYEPRFSLARSAMSKWFTAFFLLDDTYDAYGLYEELQYLTKAVQRFDRDAVEELPAEDMKRVYETVLNVLDEIEEDVSKEGRSFSVFYVKEETKKLVKAYRLEVKWTHERFVPPFDEYLENGSKSIGMRAIMALVMMGMEEADEDAYQWLANSDALILRALNVLTRLYNDQDKDEDLEKKVVSGISCYMKEYGVSKEEAFEALKERIRDGWKDLNEGFLVRPMSVPWQLLKTAFNFTRTADIYYKEAHGFTLPEKSLKEYISKVLIDPITIQD